MILDSGSEREKLLRAARRIVIKLGTSTVTGDAGEVARERVLPIVRAIAELRAERRQVVLVSSGAVGLGAGRLGLARARLKDVVTKQACAATGQSLLMNAYENLFRPHNINIAQILLTENDFTDWHRYMNLRRTMERLLKLNVLPIINENDTISTAELERVSSVEESKAQPVFGDNDRLAALVMSKLDADVLVLLTDVDGLYARRPNEKLVQESGVETNSVISLVEEITPDLKSVAAGASAGGRGGMVTKLEAAKIAMQAGGVAVIANGRRADTLGRIFAGESVGTTFMARTTRMAGKRRWIAYAAHTRGRIIVNAGAREAVVSGKASLLISGVLRIEERFEPLEVVSILDAEGQEFARGIVNCASERAKEMLDNQHAAHTTTDAKTYVLMTRNNIVLLNSLNA